MVTSCRPGLYWLQRAAAWLWLPMALLNASILLLCTWAASHMLVATGLGIGIVATGLCLLVSLTLPALALLAAIRRIIYFRRLRRLRLLIGPTGVARLNHPRLVLPWHLIRHIVVTAGRPGLRRMLVDDGTGAAAGPGDIYSGPRAGLGWTLGPHRFAIDVPIDAFDVDAALLFAAIRHFSGGRLPDLTASSCSDNCVGPVHTEAQSVAPAAPGPPTRLARRNPDTMARDQ